MASIPHGTTILAQGGAPQVISGGPQNIPNNNILPFFDGNPAPANGDFNTVAQQFPELILSQPTQFRFVAPGVTQDIVKNPNSVLQNALHASLQGTTMKSRTFLHVATDHSSGQRRRRHRQHGVPGHQRQSSRRQRQGHAGPGDVLDRDDRRHRGPGGRTSTSCSTRSW